MVGDDDTFRPIPKDCRLKMPGSPNELNDPDDPADSEL
jgi:hypothetical protein